MTEFLIIYWIIAGFAFYMQPTSKERLSMAKEGVLLLLCLILGGFIIPAKIVAKAAR